MSTVFADLGISMDGFVAGPNARPGNPLGDGGARIHQWVYSLKSWRSQLGLDGGESNSDDDLIRATMARCGAVVMCRRMFDEGETAWPENAPFRTAVFVVTHKAREPWVRPGGDELTLHLSSQFLGSGVRLFECLNANELVLSRTKVVESPAVTHLHYRVIK